MEEHPQVVKRIYQEGHAIGMHGYDHVNIKNETKEGLYAQIQRSQKIFEGILNIKPQLFRPPYGAITPEQVNYIFEKGITTIVWSVNSYDSYPDNNDLVAIYNSVTKKIYPGAIVLFHDKSAPDFPNEEHSNTIKVLPGIIEFIKEEGYRFYMLPELLQENNLPADPDR